MEVRCFWGGGVGSAISRLFFVAVRSGPVRLFFAGAAL